MRARLAALTLTAACTPAAASDAAPEPVRDVTVAIAGGGLCGLALCLGLRQHGIDAVVLERARQLRYVSRGSIAVHAMGQDALRRVDPKVAEAVRARSTDIVAGQVAREGADGQALFSEMRRQRETSWRVPWAELQDELAAAVRATADSEEDWLLCGCAVEGFKEHPGHVEVLLEGGRTLRAAVLVGADGAFSKVRRALAPWWRRLFDRPRKYPQTNWNAIIPSKAAGPSAVPEGHARYWLMRSPPMSCYHLGLAGGRVFWQVRVTDRKVALAVDRSGRGGLALTGVRDRARAVLDAELSAGDPVAAAGGHADMAALLDASEDADIFERRIVARRLPARWMSRGGRVVLVGDAAHAVHPCNAQGANLALDSAAELAGALERAHAKGRLAAGAAGARGLRKELRVYEARRKAVVGPVHRKSHKDGLAQIRGAYRQQRNAPRARPSARAPRAT